MPLGVLNEGGRPGEVLELVFRKEGVVSVVGDELPFCADKEDARPPAFVLLRGQEVIGIAPVIPGERECLPMPAGDNPGGKLILDLGLSKLQLRRLVAIVWPRE